LRASPLADEQRWRVLPTSANGQVGLALYRWDDEKRSFAAHAINVLDVTGDRVGATMFFLTPEVFERFGLPAAVTAS
jgi:hypothetical protein